MEDQTQKKKACVHHTLSFTPTGLFSLGSAHGANVSASAAFDALISIDDVLAVAFLDGVHGAFALASAAADAFSRNLQSHNQYLHMLLHICAFSYHITIMNKNQGKYTKKPGIYAPYSYTARLPPT